MDSGRGVNGLRHWTIMICSLDGLPVRSFLVCRLGSFGAAVGYAKFVLLHYYANLDVVVHVFESRLDGADAGGKRARYNWRANYLV